jgi:tubulin--tyrosine ligase
MNKLSLQTPKQKHLYALINYEDEYVQPLILAALESKLPKGSYTLITSISELPSPETPFLQISSYETLPFEQTLSNPTSTLINAYIIRKALIRKHYLSTTRHNWIAKHPNSVLVTNLKTSCDFELDYAEFLDDALVEAWELKESFEKNEGKEPGEREWWILKPGMSDRGHGIRLFSSEEELQSIFEEWEEGMPDSDDEYDDGDTDMATNTNTDKDDYNMTSHLRHFIAQPYIHPPLLLPGPTSLPTKFHIRTYVLASGSLKIYVYKQMLALFASEAYVPPWESDDLKPHLTNTCLQTSSSSPSSSNQNSKETYNPVSSFWSLPTSSLPLHQKEEIFDQICKTTAEIFEAAARGMMVHFQTLPNSFEIFGLDFLVDEGGKAWLLEVNAFPDFGQTGGELKDIVMGLWEGVVGEVVNDFFGIGNGQDGEGGIAEGKEGEGKGEGLVLVGSVDLGRK